MKKIVNAWLLSFVFFGSTFLEASRIFQKSLSDFVKEFPESSCLQCTNNYPFNHAPFPLYSEFSHFFPSQGEHADVFLLEVPKASVLFDVTGSVYINDSFIKEAQIKNLSSFHKSNFVDRKKSSRVTKIPGRVAIISHLYPYCYGHWIFDVLGQLALLEMNNVEYDYLCVPYYTKFMQQSLDIWGIDRSKIIPIVYGASIQADSIIMTTAISQDRPEVRVSSNYYIDFLLLYIQSKMISRVNSLSDKVFNGSEKIFISRKGAKGKRSVLNEDEVFALFEALGFVRYELENFSVAQQVLLFNNAKTVVSFVGSGATNILFCKPGTHYIEITQKMVDATFFFVSDTCKLKYSFINDSTFVDNGSSIWARPEPFPLHKIKEFLAKHPDL